MTKNNLPKSIRKFIRTAKAKIRREILDSKKQEEAIKELVLRFITKDKLAKDAN